MKILLTSKYLVAATLHIRPSVRQTSPPSSAVKWSACRRGKKWLPVSSACDRLSHCSSLLLVSPFSFRGLLFKNGSVFGFSNIYCSMCMIF